MKKMFQDNLIYFSFQFGRLKELLNFCKGGDVHPLIRETAEKLALASTAQVYIDIIPGYTIR